jgi:hypothetical protein
MPDMMEQLIRPHSKAGTTNKPYPQSLSSHAVLPYMPVQKVYMEYMIGNLAGSSMVVYPQSDLGPVCYSTNNCRPDNQDVANLL